MMMTILLAISFVDPKQPPHSVLCLLNWTADWAAETENKCLDAGFNGVLRKPIIFSDLKSFLAQASSI